MCVQEGRKKERERERGTPPLLLLLLLLKYLVGNKNRLLLLLLLRGGGSTTRTGRQLAHGHLELLDLPQHPQRHGARLARFALLAADEHRLDGGLLHQRQHRRPEDGEQVADEAGGGGDDGVREVDVLLRHLQQKLVHVDDVRLEAHHLLVERLAVALERLDDAGVGVQRALPQLIDVLHQLVVGAVVADVGRLQQRLQHRLQVGAEGRPNGEGNVAENAQHLRLDLPLDDGAGEHLHERGHQLAAVGRHVGAHGVAEVGDDADGHRAELRILVALQAQQQVLLKRGVVGDEALGENL